MLCAAVAGCGVPSAEPARTVSSNNTTAGQSTTAGPPSQSTDAATNDPGGEKLTISLLRADDNPVAATFEVGGLPECDLVELAKAGLTAEEWAAMFSVHVAHKGSANSDDLPPVMGSYRIDGLRIQFKPRFPLEPGLAYRARFDLTPFRNGRSKVDDADSASPPTRKPVVSEFFIPKPVLVATTIVTNVFPSGDNLPENQLKFYLHFSAPMSRGEAYRRIHLLDASGKEIADPFLELDEELWDPAGKRFTLFLDPGRIKRGLKPREEVGPVFEEGGAYAFVIDREWQDAAGNPLRESYHKRFHVGPPDDLQPDPNTWKLTAPPAGSSEPLVIKFPEPLDHAMLHRVLVIRDSADKIVSGRIEVDEHETRWRLTPTSAWSAGDYTVEVQTDLEDLAGNSIARVFDVDLLEPISRSMKAETWSVPFRVRLKETQN